MRAPRCQWCGKQLQSEDRAYCSDVCRLEEARRKEEREEGERADRRYAEDVERECLRALADCNVAPDGLGTVRLGEKLAAPVARRVAKALLAVEAWPHDGLLADSSGALAYLRGERT